MSIKEAINRINWRLTNGWQSNKNDIDAFNTLIRGVNDKATEQIDNNELIVKLFIKAFGNELKNNGASVFDPIFQKEFHKQFDRPLANFIGDFQCDLNTYEQFELLQKKEFVADHPCLATPEQDEKELDICYEIMSSENEKDTLLSRKWSYKDVKNNILTQFKQFKEDYVQGNKN